MKKSSFFEESWIVVGEVIDDVWHGRLFSHRQGKPAEVDVSWRAVLSREERFGDVIGFLHTHPSGLLRPSARDERTMEAWCSCFGKPLLCGITAGKETEGFIFSADGFVPAKKTALFPTGRGRPRPTLIAFGMALK